MKTSVCITVLNEEGSIGELLESLLAQTKKPDEIVVVDGGSKDKTVEIVRHFQKKDKRIKLLIEQGSVAHGRNTSIEIAKNPIIVSIDAGCVAKKDWLAKITEPFKHEEVGMVAGFYEMVTKTPLQKAMSVYHGVAPERFDPTSFLPSARSVAFRREVWEKVGGYSEKLDKAGEDTLFFYKIVKTGVRIIRVGEAIVYWKETSTFTFIESLKKFYQYAKGDAQAGIWWHPTQRLASHNIKISAIFIRYFLGLILLLLSVKLPVLRVVLFLLVLLYLTWAIWKWKDVVKSWEARIWLPIIQISSDLAVMWGFISGVRKSGRTDGGQS